MAENDDVTDRMIKISKLIADMQEVHRKFGDTCVYIRRGGLSWGAVALNRRADDEKNGVFDLQDQHDRDMLAWLEQIERLKKDRDEWRANGVQLEAAIREARSQIDRALGDTDPKDPAHPLLMACQRLDAVLRA